MTRTPIQQTILNAKAATGIGSPINVAGYKNVMLQVIATTPTGITIKVQGSLSNLGSSSPDFSATPSATDPWDYVACFDYQDPSTVITGDTGLTFNAADVKNLLVNVDGMTWLNVVVTARAAGSVTVKMIAFTNE